MKQTNKTLCHEHAVHGALLAQYKWTVIIIIITINVSMHQFPFLKGLWNGGQGSGTVCIISFMQIIAMEGL